MNQKYEELVKLLTNLKSKNLAPEFKFNIENSTGIYWRNAIVWNPQAEVDNLKCRLLLSDLLISKNSKEQKEILEKLQKNLEI